MGGFHLVQGEGLDRAIDRMLDVNHGPNAGDEAYVERVNEDILGKVFWSGKGRGGAALIAERLERIHDQVPVPPGRVLGELSRMNAIDALEFAEGLRGSGIFAGQGTSEQAARLAYQRAIHEE